MLLSVTQSHGFLLTLSWLNSVSKLMTLSNCACDVDRRRQLKIIMALLNFAKKKETSGFYATNNIFCEKNINHTDVRNILPSDHHWLDFNSSKLRRCCHTLVSLRMLELKHDVDGYLLS